MLKWLDTYGRHILYLSLYAGSLGFATKGLQSSSYLNAVFSLLCFGVTAINFHWELQYLLLRIGLPPGDSGLPLLGHLITYIPALRAFHNQRLKKYNGGPSTMNIFMQPCVFLSSEEDVRWAMTQERKGLMVAKWPDFLANLVGTESIVLQSGQAHRRLRRIFEPSFSPSAVKGYAQTMDDTVQSELAKWCERGEFCGSTEWANLAMRLLMECTFGKVQEDKLDKLSHYFSEWFAGTACWVPHPFPGNALYKGHQAKAALNNEIQSIVDEFKQENPQDSLAATTTMLGRLCYGVDEDGQSLSDELLIANIRVIMFAGHDTSKGSFAAFVHYLQEKTTIRELLIKEAESFSEPLCVDELKAAPLLNAFMAETWRLVPPADVHIMEGMEDMSYKSYRIQKGVGILVDVASYSITNEEVFPDPTDFRMERWLPPGHPMHDPKYYLEKVDYNLMTPKFRTFHMGAHQCLGAHFAKLEARIVLTRLLQNYNLQIGKEQLLETPLLQYDNEFKLTKRCKDD